MKIRTMALIGAAVAVLGGVSVVACSSSDNTGNPSTGNDAGQTGNDSGPNPGNDSGPVGDDSGVVSGDSGGNTEGGTPCKSPGLFVPTDAGIYCPYSYDDAGTIQYCAPGTEQCCLSPGGDAGGVSACVPFAGSGTTYNSGAQGCPTGDTMWQCSSPLDCASAGPVLPIDGGAPDSGAIVCCLVGGALASATAPYCTTAQKTHFGGTSCQPASACTGSISVTSAGKTFVDPMYVACEQPSDCTGAGQTCTPIYTSGTSIGVCLPPL